MQRCEHHTIFYPSDAQELTAQSAVRMGGTTNALTTLPGAILTPHASYPYVLDLLHESFSALGALKPKLVVILAPLHQEPLEADRPHFLFAPEGAGITLPNTSIRYATETLIPLLSLYGDSLKVENSYFVEEAAVELTLPLVASYAQGVPVLPLLSATTDAKQCRIYASIVQKIVVLEPQTLFVVSANLNAILGSALATEHANAVVSILEKGEPLLDSLRSKRISSCSIAAFEALRLQSWGGRGWEFTLFSAEERTFEMLPHEYITKERIVWHASARRKEV